MKESTTKIYKYGLLYGIAILVLLSLLTLPLYTNTADFSIYNPGWNGCSHLAVKSFQMGTLQPDQFIQGNQLEVQQQSLDERELTAATSLFIIGPQETFSAGEATAVQHYLRQGGTLLLADDFGTGNNLLEQLNATSRFSRQPLMDLSYEKRPPFVQVTNVSGHPVVENISSILLNYPTAIHTGGQATILASTSPYSWLDRHPNQQKDENEPQGPFPVLAVERYGQGEIILLSDPSLWINGMEDHLDNQQCRATLIRYMTEGRSQVVIDESHRGKNAAVTLTYFLPSILHPLIKAVIIAGAAALYLVYFTPLPRSLLHKIAALLRREATPSAPPSQVAEQVMEHHPQWDRRVVERIVKEAER